MKRKPSSKSNNSQEEHTDKTRGLSDERVREIRVAYMRRHNEVSNILFSPSATIIANDETPSPRSSQLSGDETPPKYSDNEDDVEMMGDEDEERHNKQQESPKIAWGNFWKTIGSTFIAENNSLSSNSSSSDSVLECIKIEKGGQGWEVHPETPEEGGIDEEKDVDEDDDMEKWGDSSDVSTIASVEFYTPINKNDSVDSFDITVSKTWRLSGKDDDNDDIDSISNYDLDLSKGSILPFPSITSPSHSLDETLQIHVEGDNSCSGKYIGENGINKSNKKKYDDDGDRYTEHVSNRGVSKTLIEFEMKRNWIADPMMSNCVLSPPPSLSEPFAPSGRRTISPLLSRSDEMYDISQSSPPSSSSTSFSNKDGNQLSKRRDSICVTSTLLDDATEEEDAGCRLRLGEEVDLYREKEDGKDFNRDQEEVDKIKAWREMEMETDAFFARGLRKIGEDLEEQLRLLRLKDS